MSDQMRGAVVALSTGAVVVFLLVLVAIGSGLFSVTGPLGRLGGGPAAPPQQRIQDARTCSYYGASLGRSKGWWWNEQNSTCYTTDDQGVAHIATVPQ